VNKIVLPLSHVLRATHTLENLVEFPFA